MINQKEFKKKTVMALKDSLNFSRELMDRFDPDFEDIEGRREATFLINELKAAIEEVSSDHQH